MGRPDLDAVGIEARLVGVLAGFVDRDLLRPRDKFVAVLGQRVGVETSILDHLGIDPVEPAVVVEGNGHRLAFRR